MIIKSYEISKINFLKNNFYLFYGENEGFKNEIIKAEAAINSDIAPSAFQSITFSP